MNKIMNFFKNNFKIIIYFFCIGFIVNSIPMTLNIIENRKKEKLKLLEIETLRNQKKDICKKKSDYLKFIEMGFKETAKKRFISCMENSNLIR